MARLSMVSDAIQLRNGFKAHWWCGQLSTRLQLAMAAP